MTSKFNRILEVVELHVHAKFNQAECSGSYELSCPQTFLFYLAMVKNPKIWSSVILKFSGFRAVVKEHVRAKFHRAKCSGS